MGEAWERGYLCTVRSRYPIDSRVRLCLCSTTPSPGYGGGLSKKHQMIAPVSATPLTDLGIGTLWPHLVSFPDRIFRALGEK